MTKELYRDKKEKGICIYCKKEFYKTMVNQKFCNDKCSSKLKWKNKIKKEKENGIISNPLKVRFEIFKRDNFCCVYCGRNPREDKIKLHIDHKHPKNKGGADLYENFVTSCTDCNYGKSDVLLEIKNIKK